MKLSAEAVRDIIQYVKGHAHPRFAARQVMARKYGVSSSQVSRICGGGSRRNIRFGMGLPKRARGRA